MTLKELYRVVDELPDSDLDALQDYIERRKREADVRQLRGGLDALREGLTENEILQIQQAMNAKTAVPMDINEWKD